LRNAANAFQTGRPDHIEFIPNLFPSTIRRRGTATLISLKRPVEGTYTTQNRVFRFRKDGRVFWPITNTSSRMSFLATRWYAIAPYKFPILNLSQSREPLS
jgi:hypothetical protein